MRKVLYKNGNLINAAIYYSEEEKEKIKENLDQYYREYETANFIISISEKGNLVFTRRFLTPFVNKEIYEEEKNGFWEEYKEIPEKKDKINFLKQKNGMIRRRLWSKWQFVRIATEKIIITTNGTCYHLCYGKLQRLSLKTHLQRERFCFDLSNVFSGICFQNILSRHPELDHEMRPYIEKVFDTSKYFNKSCYLLTKNFKTNEILMFVKKIESFPKWFRKIFFEEKSDYDKMSFLELFHSISMMGFKNQEVVKKIFSFYKKQGTIYINELEDLIQPIKKYLSNLKKFYLKNPENNAENIAYNRIFKKMLQLSKKNELNNLNNSFAIKDSLYMYYIHTLKKMKNKQIGDLKPSFFKSDLNDIHDYLSEITVKEEAIMNYKVYNYNENDKKLEKKINNCSFLLPKNSLELSRLAQIMHNCVARYNSNIYNNSSIIIYATDSADIINYIQNDIGDCKALEKRIKDFSTFEPLCIELNRDENNEGIVRQCYTIHNKKPDNNETGEIAEEYFKDINYKVPRYVFSTIELENYPEADDLPF